MKQQQFLVALVLACVATAAPAQTIETRVLGCAGVNTQEQRLACFDTLARDVAAGSAQAVEEDNA